MAESVVYDTNILVHLVRGDQVGARLKAEYAPLIVEPRPSICVVTMGELRSLAYQWSWGRQKRDQMNFLLGFFWRLPIDLPEMIEACALIDSFSERSGRTMGKNDVWIAAAAHLTDSKLITTDKDFEHLQPGFLRLEWMNSELEHKTF